MFNVKLFLSALARISAILRWIVPSKARTGVFSFNISFKSYLIAGTCFCFCSDSSMVFVGALYSSNLSPSSNCKRCFNAGFTFELASPAHAILKLSAKLPIKKTSTQLPFI